MIFIIGKIIPILILKGRKMAKKLYTKGRFIKDVESSGSTKPTSDYFAEGGNTRITKYASGTKSESFKYKIDG